MITDEHLAEIRKNASELYSTEGLEGMAMTTTAVAIQEAKQKAFLLGFMQGENCTIDRYSKISMSETDIQQCDDCPMNIHNPSECMRLFINRCGYSCNKGKYK